MSPSSETFVVEAIFRILKFPFVGFFSYHLCRHRGSKNWAPTDRPGRPSAGVYMRMEVQPVDGKGEAVTGVTADLIAKTRVGDYHPCRQRTSPPPPPLQRHSQLLVRSFQ